MKLEVGKYYKTRDGRKVGPVESTPENGLFGKCYVWTSGWRGSDTPAENLFCENGRYWESGTMSDNDLIAPWLESPNTGTLAELGVKPGDVVGFVEERGNPYGYTYPTGPVTVLDRGLVFGIMPECDDAIWRIVYRTPGHENKPNVSVMPGPVITETVTRFVPGVYGGGVRIGCDGFLSIEGIALCASSLRTIRAAVATLSQIADAMPDE